MTEHPNVALVRGLFDAFKRGDVAQIDRSMHPEAVWHFPGRRGALAGSHAGREAIFGFLGKVAQLTGGSFHLELERVLAGDDTAVAFFTGRGEREGRTLENPTCLKIRIENGKIMELREFVWDLEDVEAFWS